MTFIAEMAGSARNPRLFLAPGTFLRLIVFLNSDETMYHYSNQFDVLMAGIKADEPGSANDPLMNDSSISSLNMVNSPFNIMLRSYCCRKYLGPAHRGISTANPMSRAFSNYQIQLKVKRGLFHFIP